MKEFDKKKNEKTQTDQSAKEIAEIMAQNMAANMNDPNFESEQDRIHEEAARKVLMERKKRAQKSEEK